MNTDIVVIVVVLLIGAGAAFIVLRQRRMPREERDARRLHRNREDALKRATKEHDKAVHQAEKALETANKVYAKAVRSADKALSEAMTPPVLGAIAGVVLTEESIRTPQGTAQLGPGVSATVDTAGNLAVTKRVTLTRLVAGGVVGGLLFQKKQKHDTRELYLLVETPEFASIVQCPPDKGPQVRQFAVLINNAARRVEMARAARQQAIVSARASADAIRADRSAIGRAEQALTLVRSDTAAVDSATTLLQSSSPDLDQGSDGGDQPSTPRETTQ